MSEKVKQYMSKQISQVVEKLETTFELPVFQDEIADDELESLQQFNCFVFATGEFQPMDSKDRLNQNIDMFYYAENDSEIDETTVEIITAINSINTIWFTGSVKDRLQIKDTDRFVDRVALSFKRVIPLGR